MKLKIYIVLLLIIFSINFTKANLGYSDQNKPKLEAIHNNIEFTPYPTNYSFNFNTTNIEDGYLIFKNGTQYSQTTCYMSGIYVYCGDMFLGNLYVTSLSGNKLSATNNITSPLYCNASNDCKPLEQWDTSFNSTFDGFMNNYTTSYNSYITNNLTDNYYRIANLPINSTNGTITFELRAVSHAGTVSTSLVSVVVAHRYNQNTTTRPSITALTGHSYNSGSTADNGWVLYYLRLSFDSNYYYIDAYKYKAMNVYLKIKPYGFSDWNFSTGNITSTKDVSAWSNARTVQLGQGLYGDNIYANGASYATYSTYGMYGSHTLSDNTNKAGNWSYFGYYQLSYSASYLGGHSYNGEIVLNEVARNGTKRADQLENIKLRLKIVQENFSSSTVFTNVAPSIYLEIDGNNSLNGSDVACLVYSNTTSSKVIRCYVRLNQTDTNYDTYSLAKYGERFTTSGSYTSDSGFVYATDSAVIGTLPTPSQGSIIYAKKVINDNLWHTNGNDIYYNEGNVSIGSSVGIGTSSPTQSLDVNGSVKIGTETDGYGRIFLAQKYPRALPTTLLVGADDNGTSDSINFGGGTVAGYITKHIYFHTALNNTSSGSNIRLAIDDTGKIGVNTTSPNSILETNGDIRSTRVGNNNQYLEIDGGDANGIYLTASSLTAAPKPIILNADVSDGTATTSTYYSFKVDGNEKMRITNDNISLTSTSATNLLVPSHTMLGTFDSGWYNYSTLAIGGGVVGLNGAKIQIDSGGSYDKLTINDGGIFIRGSAGGQFSIGVAGISKGGAGNFFTNYAGDLVFSSNLNCTQYDCVNTYIVNSHNTLSGAMMLVPGNAKPYTNHIQFYSAKSTPVTAGSLFTPKVPILDISPNNTGTVCIGCFEPRTKLDVNGSAIMDSVNITNGLINLNSITLPSCISTLIGSIGRNNTGTYGCNSTNWVRIF